LERAEGKVKRTTCPLPKKSQPARPLGSQPFAVFRHIRAPPSRRPRRRRQDPGLPLRRRRLRARRVARRSPPRALRVVDGAGQVPPLPLGRRLPHGPSHGLYLGVSLPSVDPDGTPFVLRRNSRAFFWHFRGEGRERAERAGFFQFCFLAARNKKKKKGMQHSLPLEPDLRLVF